ncbi:hypothetical protein H4R26_003547 [Coemansia thaxteri]|uniref:Expansin-like EG45 domain-containing protein n=1 Tax=Coemansia thaxteri TaxID=2663907 RepID=A0A9W8BCH9_9FUNG|nr:hypothetical protein H4R26_003547 [Coemansia thaxteri]KAJ2480795.1 hypothetical protein EV174_003629 [Coemansia sp. RSA 2320]
MARWSVLLVTMAALALAASSRMTGRQSITPHDYQGLGLALAQSAPSCGFPYVTLDISRITAVQLMSVSSECGTCLRVETAQSNYIVDGAAAGLPGIAMATHFEATAATFEQLPLVSVSKRDTDEVRYIYVLAVDTGGRGLDMAQVSFTALFGQSLSPMPASWFPVDPKYCQDMWRNTTKEQLQSPTLIRKIPVFTGRSQAPAGLAAAGPIKGEGTSGSPPVRSFKTKATLAVVAGVLLLLPV